MTELSENNKKLAVNIALTFLYAIFTIFIVLHHEIWRDEAQVWLLLKYIRPFELFDKLINEGHPPLFYLLVMPFVKLKLNIISMQLLCWGFSVAGVFLLLNFSPFRWWLKLSVILSAGLIYGFPVIARSYSILPFLVFLAAILYSKSKEHPILYSFVLLLISQTHYLMFGFVCVLLGFYVFECIKDKIYSKGAVIGFLIVSAGLLTTLFRAFQSADSNYFIGQSVNGGVLNQSIAVLYQFLAASLGPHGFMMLLILFFVIFLTLFIRLLLISPKAFMIAVLGIAFQFLVYIKYYPDVLFVNRVFISYLILIFSFWISVVEKSTKTDLIMKTEIIMTVFLTMTIPNGISMCFKDYYYSYSASKETAEYIVNNLDKEAILLTDTLPMTESICAYLPEDYKIYGIITGKPIKYVVWNNSIKSRFNQNQWEEYIKNHKFSEKKLYIVQSADQATKFDRAKIEFVSNKSLIKGETFIIQEYEK